MLVNQAFLLSRKILSLHAGGKIATPLSCVIGREAAQLMGLLVLDEEGQEKLLRMSDLREIADLGLIVDSEDVFLDLEDAVRLQKVLSENYQVIGLPVRTVSGQRLGRVVECHYDVNNYKIAKLLVQKTFFGFYELGEPLLVARAQVVDFSSRLIIVKDNLEPAPEVFEPNFINPFREQQPLPLRNQSHDELDN